MKSIRNKHLGFACLLSIFIRAASCLGLLSLPLSGLCVSYVYAQTENSEVEVERSTGNESDADGIIRLSDTITGNREQPKVLYVIPWQKAEDKSILYQSLKSTFGNVFSQVEEAEHKREIEFLDAFLKQSKEQK